MFAFVVASGASLLLYRVLINRPQPAKAAQATAKVVLAAHDLEAGAVLHDADLVLTDWPSAIPAGSSGDAKGLVGRGVITAMVAKEPVIESRLAARGAGGGLASMIPSGMRAVAIRVNDVAGVAGFVVAGLHVDVLISGNAPNTQGNVGTLTKTLLQNIEVLSAGQDFKKDAEGKPVMVAVVNLLVTPEQAEQLSLASSQTTIQLVLRNPLDRDVAKTPGTALAHLFDGGRLSLPPPQPKSNEGRRTYVAQVARVAPPPPPLPKKEPFTMEIISGTKKTEVKFDNAGGGK